VNGKSGKMYVFSGNGVDDEVVAPPAPIARVKSVKGGKGIVGVNGEMVGKKAGKRKVEDEAAVERVEKKVKIEKVDDELTSMST
jgi:hypothetical protein